MRVIILSSVFLIMGMSSFGQNLKPSKDVVNDFASAVYYQYKYSNRGGVKSWVYLTGQRLGYNLVDIEIAVESITKDNRFREELFKTFLKLYRGDEQFISLNLISIGMRATSAKYLANYILDKYKDEVDAEKNSIRQKNLQESEIHYEIVDKEATFIGGRTALAKYLNDNIKYPASASLNNISGKVVIGFTIDEEGNTGDVHIEEGAELGYGIPEEAMRVIKFMPKWSPSSIKGRPVKAYRRQPLTF